MTIRNKMSWPITVILSLGLTATACAAENQDAAPAAYPAPPAAAPDHAGAGQVAAPSPLILYDAPEGRPYMQALISGVLRRERDCVYIGEGEHRMLLILPSPTARWDAARGTIRFGDREYRFGDEAAFGGGGGELAPGPEAQAARRLGCDTSPVWWASPERVDMEELRRRPIRVNPPPPPPVRKRSGGGG